MAKTASASSEFRTDYYHVATRAITKHPILIFKTKTKICSSILLSMASINPNLNDGRNEEISSVRRGTHRLGVLHDDARLA